jgi:hypothetical protein
MFLRCGGFRCRALARPAPASRSSLLSLSACLRFCEALLAVPRRPPGWRPAGACVPSVHIYDASEFNYAGSKTPSEPVNVLVLCTDTHLAARRGVETPNKDSLTRLVAASWRGLRGLSAPPRHDSSICGVQHELCVQGLGLQWTIPESCRVFEVLRTKMLLKTHQDSQLSSAPFPFRKLPPKTPIYSHQHCCGHFQGPGGLAPSLPSESLPMGNAPVVTTQGGDGSGGTVSDG